MKSTSPLTILDLFQVDHTALLFEHLQDVDDTACREAEALAAVIDKGAWQVTEMIRRFPRRRRRLIKQHNTNAHRIAQELAGMIGAKHCNICRGWFIPGGNEFRCDACQWAIEVSRESQRRLRERQLLQARNLRSRTATYGIDPEVLELTYLYPVLSIQQPWAWAVIHGGKDIENRTWRYQPKYRGPLLIHTGKQWYSGWRPVDLRRDYDVDAPDDMPRGGIVGTVDLVDVVTDSSSYWFNGPLGLVFANPRLLPFTPCNGARGFFRLQLNEQGVLAPRRKSAV